MLHSPITLPSTPPQPVPRRGRQRSVVFYRTDPASHADGHDLRSKAVVAERLAGLLGYDFGGDFYDAPQGAGRPLYFVPSDTLGSLEQAQRLGIRDVDDLFGGVVPFPFVATKLISHPLHAADSAAPRGWSPAFGRRVGNAVLPGYSAFRINDARNAGRDLLEGGAVRLKDPGGVGGVGQWVVRSADELEDQLQAFGADKLAAHGLVLERNLNNVTTRSVGRIRAGDFRAAYCGTQSTTRNHRGDEVYGGSDLLVARGGFAELLQLDLDPDVRMAIEQAAVFDAAAASQFAGMLASRCNYDVAQGSDDTGTQRSGVLEQSWRIGGASGAEVAALQAFATDADRQVVRASTCELYGHDSSELPPGAWVLYDGVDAHVGQLLKYVVTADHGDA